MIPDPHRKASPSEASPSGSSVPESPPAIDVAVFVETRVEKMSARGRFGLPFEHGFTTRPGVLLPPSKTREKPACCEQSIYRAVSKLPGRNIFQVKALNRQKRVLNIFNIPYFFE